MSISRAIKKPNKEDNNSNLDIIKMVGHFDENQLLAHYKSVKSIFQCFRFFGKELSISRYQTSVLRLVSNENPGNFAFFRGIHEFLHSLIFEYITRFFFFSLKNNGFLNSTCML